MSQWSDAAKLLESIRLKMEAPPPENAQVDFIHSVAEILGEWNDEKDPNFVRLANAFDALANGLSESALKRIGIVREKQEEEEDEDDSEDD